jgi:hypothetical protein
MLVHIAVIPPPPVFQTVMNSQSAAPTIITAVRPVRRKMPKLTLPHVPSPERSYTTGI